ncbi:hypothetical protein ACLKA7_000890 [Drosophila subpalustris]
MAAPQHQTTMPKAGESKNPGRGVSTRAGSASPRDQTGARLSSEVEQAITYDIDIDRMPKVMSEIFVDKAARWFLGSGRILGMDSWDSFCRQIIWNAL